MILDDYIRHFPGFPHEGIVFHDLSPLLASPAAFGHCVERLAGLIAPWKPDLLAGIEARGFLLAGALALATGPGLVMVRKKGKLPGPVVAEDYTLEYGTAVLQMQADALCPGQRVVMVDDLLATGGSLRAGIRLARKFGAEVCGAACIMEMPDLKGRETLDVPVVSLIRIAGD